MSEIQSVEGKPLKKGLSPARRSAVGALVLLGVAVVVFVVGTVFRPAAIPADHVLALIRADGSVDLALADASAPATLGGPGVAPEGARIVWAPGGDFLAIRTAIEVLVIDRDGVVVSRRPIRWAQASVAWSPDGRRLAVYDAAVEDEFVATDPILDVYTPTGELEWRVPLADGFGVVTGFDNLAWSPDSGSIAFTGFTDRVTSGRQWASVWLADVGAQTFRQVTMDVDRFEYGPAWSTGGGLVVGEISTLESGLWRIDPATGDRTPLLRTAMELCPVHAPCSAANLDPLVPSPDGSLLAFHEPTFGLSIIDVATRELIKVQAPGTLADIPVVWSVDGKALLYLRHAGAAPDPADPPDLVRFELASRETAVVQADVTGFDLLPVTP